MGSREPQGLTSEQMQELSRELEILYEVAFREGNTYSEIGDMPFGKRLSQISGFCRTIESVVSYE